MSDERWVSLTDPTGAQTDVDVTVERFASLLDAVDPDELEHTVVSLEDSGAWYLEYNRDYLAFGNAEGGDPVVLKNVDRDEVLGVAADFISGDLDALRARPWRAW